MRLLSSIERLISINVDNKVRVSFTRMCIPLKIKYFGLFKPSDSYLTLILLYQR